MWCPGVVTQTTTFSNALVEVVEEANPKRQRGHSGGRSAGGISTTFSNTLVEVVEPEQLCPLLYNHILYIYKFFFP